MIENQRSYPTIAQRTVHVEDDALDVSRPMQPRGAVDDGGPDVIRVVGT